MTRGILLLLMTTLLITAVFVTAIKKQKRAIACGLQYTTSTVLPVSAGSSYSYVELSKTFTDKNKLSEDLYWAYVRPGKEIPIGTWVRVILEEDRLLGWIPVAVVPENSDAC